MRKKIAAFAATLLVALAIVGFSGVAPKEAEPAQAWYYSYCTTASMDGTQFCYKRCSGMEIWWVQNCNSVVRLNYWSA